MPDFRAESFTNEFGQVINPGDQVVFISTSYKSTRVKMGVFQGVYYRNIRKYDREERKWGERKVQPAAVKVTSQGSRYKWYGYGDERNGSVPCECTSVLEQCRVYRLDTPMSQLVGSYV